MGTKARRAEIENPNYFLTRLPYTPESEEDSECLLTL